MKDNWAFLVELLAYFKADLIISHDPRNSMTTAQVIKNAEVIIQAQIAGGAESSIPNKLINEAFKKLLK